MNYFSYLSEIEDTFIRRRGKHLHLCSLDWVLMEIWKERGVPLHVVLRGVEVWFDNFERRRSKRPVNTILYCEDEVEAQYAEWLESRVGSHDAAETETENDKSPFPRTIVLQHLDRVMQELAKLAADLKPKQDELGEVFERELSLLSEIRDDYEVASLPDSRKLEESLTGIERLLDDAMRGAIGETELTSMRSEVDAQVKPYKRHMEKEVFAQTRENLLKKRLREHFGVPRLSLFFL